MCQKLIISGSIFLLLFNFSCKKANTTPTTYRGKVVGIACGTVVVDVEGNNGIGTSWRGTDAITYTNAVTALDYCYIINKNVQVGNTISFNITTTKTTPDSQCTPTSVCVTMFGPVNTIYVSDVAIVSP